MLNKYKLGFDIWGLFLFLIIMIPNFIWFVVPAPNDVLRADSATESIDAIASVCQVFMVISLCFIIDKKSPKFCIAPLTVLVMICCLLYFVCWIGYYTSIVNSLTLLGLTVFPCMAFILFAISRKNIIAIIPTAVFSVCHLIYCVVNFMI